MKNLRRAISYLMIACYMFTGCQSNIKKCELDITQIRSICNLATLECYYHNVAMSEKEATTWFQKDKKFWLEYTGIAKIGIDMSRVSMEIDGTDVTVKIPNAELLGIDICEDDINTYSSEDGLVKNVISAEDQSEAINKAQLQMAEQVKNNKTLLINAQGRAQKLIENYVDKMGEISGVEYNIKWEYETANDSVAKN